MHSCNSFSYFYIVVPVTTCYLPFCPTSLKATCGWSFKWRWVHSFVFLFGMFQQHCAFCDIRLAFLCSLLIYYSFYFYLWQVLQSSPSPQLHCMSLSENEVVAPEPDSDRHDRRENGVFIESEPARRAAEKRARNAICKKVDKLYQECGTHTLVIFIDGRGKLGQSRVALCACSLVAPAKHHQLHQQRHNLSRSFLCCSFCLTALLLSLCTSYAFVRFLSLYVSLYVPLF